MSWKLHERDNETGRSVWINRDGDNLHWRITYCSDDIVDSNRVAFNDSIGKKWGAGQIVASIPLNLYYEQLAEAQDQGDDRYVSAWLNDPDNRAFRTFWGRV